MARPSEDDLRKELSPGEELLWSGSPRGGLRWRRMDLLLVLSCLPMVAFALAWVKAVGRQVPEMALFGGVFLIPMAYMAVGRFFVDAWLRARTIYGVTTERVLVLGGAARREVRSRSLAAVGELAFRAAVDGSGTLTFGPNAFPFAWFEGVPWPGAAAITPLRFELIEQVREVQEIVRQAQRRPR